MGYLANGTYFDAYDLNTPLHVFILVLICTSVILTLGSVYFTARHISNRRFTNLMIVLLLIVMIHIIVRYLSLFSDSPPIIDWISTTFGMFIVLGSAILQCEILYFFSPLAIFWTPKRIRIFEIGWVFLYAICHVEGYFQLAYLGERIPLSIPPVIFMNGYGVTLFALSASIAFTVQSLYLIKLVYTHFMISKQETLVQRVPQMKRFLLTIAMGSIVDWVAILLYAIGIFIGDPRTYRTLGIFGLYMHTYILTIVFYQLKFITIVQEDDSKAPKRTIVFLKDLKEYTTNSQSNMLSFMVTANSGKSKFSEAKTIRIAK